MTYQNAIELARNSESMIGFNEASATPYFYFTNVYDYFVLFRDARSVDTYVKLGHEYDIPGLAYWNIMQFCPQTWFVIISQYNILKTTTKP